MTAQHLEKAARVRARYDETLAEIRSDASLSKQGKAELMRREWSSASTGISTAREAHEKERDARVATLHKNLFGSRHRENENPQVAAQGYQSAIERAEQSKTPEEALHSLERSQFVGNERLARAIALVATERQWTGVVDAWLEKAPEEQAAWDEYSRLTSRPLTKRFNESVAFGVPTRPAEVQELERHGLNPAATPVGLRGASNGGRG